MPLRGDIVRQIGEAFRAKKEALGRIREDKKINSAIKCKDVIRKLISQ
jgi:hypothetical protein